MRSKSLLIISLILFFSASSLYAQIEKMQAIYIFNFLPEIEWPKETRTENVVIGVLGSNEKVIVQLQTITKGKKVGSRPIVITGFSSVANISNCQILFIPPMQTAYLGKAIEKIGSSSTLLISSTSNGIEQGAAINFVVLKDKLNFEIKPANASKYRVKISSSLVQLAAKVYR